VLHLLYARFWHKVLFDLGYVSTPEPFFKLVNQGLILGEVEYLLFQTSDKDGNTIEVSASDLVNIIPTSMGKARAVAHHKDRPKEDVILGLPVGENEILKLESGFVLKRNPSIRIHSLCLKMSKSRGNVVNPDDVLVEYGADAFRLYEMFMGPLQDTKPWNTRGVEGVYRFLGRVWRLFVDENSETEFEQAETTTKEQSNQELLNLIKLNSAIRDVSATPAQLKTLHACIKKVTEDLDGMRFNTAISAMMVFINDAITWETKPAAILRDFLILLQPFAPHIADELWQKLSTLNSQPSTNLAYASWPKFDAALLVENEIEIPMQVNGKLRDVIKVSVNATAAELEARALANEKAKPYYEGKTIKKIIVVPKKLVNIVAV
jgi:leucyl-tRNA synthetase